MKRIFMITLCAAAVLILGAWGEKSVELLDSGKLIDLDKAIELAKPGGDLPNKPVPAEDTQNTPDTPPTGDSEDKSPESREIIIIIKEQYITYDGRRIQDMDTLEICIRNNADGNVTFVLVDYWAEAHAYREALGILRRLRAETGLEFAEGGAEDWIK